VKNENMHFIDINTIEEARKIIKEIGSDPKSIDIMAPKALTKVIRVKDVILQDAIIIKQDMLSLGGEVAVPKNTFKLHDKTGDILIIGNLKQIRELIIKLDRHYPRLKKISEQILKLIKDVK
jgi:dihydropteroate synthase